MQAHDLTAGTSYELRASAEEFLRAWPDLRSVLDEAAARARQIFGPVPLAVERRDDWDSPAEDPALFLYVRTSLEGAVAADLLRRFDDDWWLDNAARAHGRLHVSVQFG